MALPKFSELFNPILEALHFLEGSSENQELISVIGFRLGLTIDEMKEIHSGTQTKLSYRLTWALYHLLTCGLIENPIRGDWYLTTKGLKIRSVDPSQIISLVASYPNGKHLQEEKRDCIRREVDQ